MMVMETPCHRAGEIPALIQITRPIINVQTCDGAGGTYRDCSYCGNTRTISGTAYDKVTVSGPFGGNNVTYEVAGSGRTQTTYCMKCMGFCISYPDVQKAYNKLWRKCTKCNGTGKPAK